MKRVLLAVILLLISSQLYASDTGKDLKAFAHNYFEKMVATQSPDATNEDLESYLKLLTDDIGHTHLPWETDGTRKPGGKESMRKGMIFYLGSHTEYSAELLEVFIFNDSAIALRYKDQAKGIHPQSNQKVEYSQTMMEILEMDQGKVAVIRKYHE
ncbi:nuclear transport factor 2 family protein [uncultured Microbulbifer sp.]|uniref:nuclear transport factor 2 family protein n=1 Tax=uncultured Microbulbifer sp. TaxID=348147 RepID=UPI00261674DF|nr:nuclear transport factor 2 family protein [uncultured Microbulbifer sp.]